MPTQAVGGRGSLAKEGFGIGIEGVCGRWFAVIMIHDLAQTGGEDLWIEGALEDILAGFAGVLTG
jgi:hypothetical protein